MKPWIYVHPTTNSVLDAVLCTGLTAILGNFQVADCRYTFSKPVNTGNGHPYYHKLVDWDEDFKKWCENYTTNKESSKFITLVHFSAEDPVRIHKTAGIYGLEWHTYLLPHTTEEVELFLTQETLRKLKC